MRSRIGRCWIPGIACLLVVASTAGAAPPEDITYQGRLLDSVGAPLAGPVAIEIAIYSQPTGGFTLYSETHPGVTLEDGVFDILIGAGGHPFGSFDAALFAARNRYLEVIVDGEALEPRQPFSSVAYALRSDQSEAAAYADKAGDADTVDGSHAADLDQSGHVSDTGNPHGVTAAQAGAATTADISAAVSTHTVDDSAHHARYADAEAVAAIQAADGSGSELDADRVDGQHASAFAWALHSHDARYYTQAEVDAIVASLQSQIDDLASLTQHLSRSGDDIYVTGANLHIVSGSGGTGSFVNGLGNLIVGYNELRDSGNDRSGSHNVVVGMEHNYSSFGGLVTGHRNTLSNSISAVTGGYLNTASGNGSSVSGGWNNTASGDFSSVSGGTENTASATSSSVSGGTTRSVSGTFDWRAGSLFENN